MTSTQVLSDFASALASGAIEVVDLSAPLGPDTPLIKLPPEIEQRTRQRSRFMPYRTTTRTVRSGPGTGSSSASIPARISTRRCTGSVVGIIKTVSQTPSR